MTIVCERADSLAEVAAWLRRDVLATNGSLMLIERGIPGVPYETWAAHDVAGTLVGAMFVEHFPTWTAAQLHPDTPEAIPVMLARLDPATRYTFITDEGMREHLLPRLADVGHVMHSVRLALAPGEGRLVEPPIRCEMRRLLAADRDMLDRFRTGRNPHGMTLVDQVARADEEKFTFFGLVVSGELVSWLQFGWNIDAIWEVGMIETRPDERRKGYGKALLSYASADMGRRGLTCYYSETDNEPSRRTAAAVGYREVARVISCEGHGET